jgi:hypothetical protein
MDFDYDHKKQTPGWMKWIPLVSLVVGLCALTFQITVLYPWHEELSREFHILAKAVKVSL